MDKKQAKIREAETALKYFAKIADAQDVPVGITVTDSGKFAVKYSLSQKIELRQYLELAVEHIVETYKKHRKNA